MLRNIITTVTLSAMLLAISPAASAMASAKVQVTLPDFPVTLNGETIDNNYRQYPLLVYKDITYFPMTYYDCRFLGLDTDWSEKNGLVIAKSNVTGAYHQQTTNQKNNRSATADIAGDKITINGKAINNSQEQYPLLNYRNVTYFPLTWRFAAEEFGWQYQFDAQKGLTIDAGNAKTSSILLNDGLKDSYGDSGYIFDFAADTNYFYYQGEKGAIYRRPLIALQDDSKQKTIYNIPKENSGYYEGYRPAVLEEMSGRIYVTYHYGGATMGHDERYHLDENGVSEDLNWFQYSPFFDFGDFQLQIAGVGAGGPMSGPMQLTDQNGQRDIGESGYYYQLNADDVLPYDRAKNRLYLLAHPSSGSIVNLERGYLSAMDLITGKLTRLVDIPVDSYRYNNGFIYYTIPQPPLEPIFKTRTLYALNLANNQTEEITDVSSYTSCANGVYYCPLDTDDLYFWNRHTGKREPINSGAALTQLYSQNGYTIAHFAETPENPYRLMVFAPSGQTMKTVYATADVSDKAIINPNGLLIYRLNGASQLVATQLP